MAIKGPKIQMPTTLSQMFETDAQGQILSMKPDWASFFHSLQQTAFAHTRSGPTASRPTGSLDGRWIGMPYMDLTLGYVVFLKIASTNVWVDANGVVR